MGACRGVHPRQEGGKLSTTAPKTINRRPIGPGSHPRVTGQDDWAATSRPHGFYFTLEGMRRHPSPMDIARLDIFSYRDPIGHEVLCIRNRPRYPPKPFRFVFFRNISDPGPVQLGMGVSIASDFMCFQIQCRYGCHTLVFSSHIFKKKKEG